MGRDKAKDIFLNYIKEKGLRNTNQREVILDTFLHANKHITVEELFNTVKKKNPEIGYATVHRNLKLMCECGVADEIKIGTSKARFEQKYGHEHHDHLICLKCGRFIEVNDDRIEKLQDKLAEANDFIPQRHKLEIYGLCKKCK
ncbi:MAG: transcriptional repressor [Nitrospirae bacterium RIFCSPHIGHO2_02_FULL_40_19]|nr:MAG: transcriptional repressor [Nitrospirae bacterium RIFCSPHIGHO2_02_FULL_40_19]